MLALEPRQAPGDVVCQPPALCAGVLFNVLIPEWLQTVLLVILLAYVIRNTARKARKQWDSEQANLKRKASTRPRSHPPPPAARQPLLPPEGRDIESQPPAKDEHDSSGRALPRKNTLQQLLEMEDHPGGVIHEEAFFPHNGVEAPPEPAPPSPRPVPHKTILQRIPFLQIAEIVVLWLLFLYSQQLKSRFGRCTWQYLSMLGAQTVILLAVCAGQIWYQVNKAETRPDDLDPELRIILATDREQEQGEGGVE